MNAATGESTEEQRAFTRRVLTDVAALERMLDDGAIESDARRIGAEQEVFLVDEHFRPRSVAVELLERLDDPHFAAELGRFNLELNLDPVVVGQGFLSRLEDQLDALLAKLETAAGELGARVLLSGILPTLDPSHLGVDNMTPKSRYRILDKALKEGRGAGCDLHILGVDELHLRHPNVMPEACTTSFQVHVQVGAGEFARFYNAAQLASAPVLAVAANSPLLFGKRLWHETRIALFRQATDDRPETTDLRRRPARVSFGNDWVRESVLEIFRDNVTRHRPLMTDAPGEDALARWAAGAAPELAALSLHNSTVWRWNRPCYGVTGGEPHLRIENRVLPAGPTVLDEIANAAFWLGLVTGLCEEHGDVGRRLPFHKAKESFLAAARMGLDAQLHWLGSARKIPARELVAGELLALAHRGLRSCGLDASEAERYLGVVAERIEKETTPSLWQLRSLEAMAGKGTENERLAALSAAIYAGQRKGEPIARWPPARRREIATTARHFERVRQVMSPEPFTVAPDEVLDLATCLMDWHHLRHVPVEDAEHRLLGLVTYRSLLRFLGGAGRDAASVPVRRVMIGDVVTVTPETPTLEAIRLLQERRIGCLPVVAGGRLVGIVSERDLLGTARAFLERGDGDTDSQEPVEHDNPRKEPS